MCKPSGPTRVIVVWGSETNQTQNFMNLVVNDWKENHSKNVEIVKLIEGNAASKEFEDINSSNYDMIIVGTSSYGDGDAPTGFGKFLYKLYEASKSDEKPFKGMDHCVIGFGSTYYETFQNCPRLVDKLLGESGSRRCQKRVEIDEMSEEDLDEQVKKWSDQTAAIFSNNSAATDPVCEWTEPADLIVDKNLGPDGFEVGDGLQDSSTRLGITAAMGIVGAGLYYYLYMRNTVEETSQ